MTLACFVQLRLAGVWALAAAIAIHDLVCYVCDLSPVFLTTLVHCTLQPFGALNEGGDSGRACDY